MGSPEPAWTPSPGGQDEQGAGLRPHHRARYAALAEATPMDPADLPGYAGRLFDHFTARPDHYRLIAWGRLEVADTAAAHDNPIQVSTARKLEQLRQEQQAGQVDPAWGPVDVLALVSQLALYLGRPARTAHLRRSAGTGPLAPRPPRRPCHRSRKTLPPSGLNPRRSEEVRCRRCLGLGEYPAHRYGRPRWPKSTLQSWLNRQYLPLELPCCRKSGSSLTYTSTRWKP